MYWLGLFHWSHGSTGSEDPCLLVPGRYYRSQQAVLPLGAVLPLPGSGTTARGGTTAPGERYYRSGRYYRGSPRYYRDPNRTHPPADLPCSSLLGFCISFLVFFVIAFWVGQVVALVSL